MAYIDLIEPKELMDFFAGRLAKLRDSSALPDTPLKKPRSKRGGAPTVPTAL